MTCLAVSPLGFWQPASSCTPSRKWRAALLKSRSLNDTAPPFFCSSAAARRCLLVRGASVLDECETRREFSSACGAVALGLLALLVAQRHVRLKRGEPRGVQTAPLLVLVAVVVARLLVEPVLLGAQQRLRRQHRLVGAVVEALAHAQNGRLDGVARVEHGGDRQIARAALGLERAQPLSSTSASPPPWA